MSFNLKDCDQACTFCVSNYIKKHRIKKGGAFETECSGIPKVYIKDHILSALGGDNELTISSLDPVTWAKVYLDWHCLDPVGEVWKRKSKEGTLPPNAAFYDEDDPDCVERAKSGKSIFHRPYQSEMLRCSSRYKIFRCGRQLGKTEIICIAIAHAIWTNSKFKAVVIAPYQSQIDMIFGRISEMFRINSILAGSIVQNVKAPNYKIQLKNGSSVLGFTAGTRSGQEAGAARGQPANMLCFDEADYLVPADINAALATIANFPKATVWMSSTPTGRREKFYKTCRSTEYKEFFFSSHVNPNWTEKQDKFFKSQLTEAGYKHEIKAEFGEQEEGVYQHRFIEAAMSNYKYQDMKPMPGWIYMMGVDWNDRKIGTQIAIVGASSTDKNLYLVEKVVVQKSEWTQLTACDKIAELNRKWNPAYIYVDKGFGTTQIEVLTKFGYDEMIKHGAKHPNARLREIVKGYDFGSQQDVTDPFTKQKVKKHSKSFLVENSVRRFEQLSFKFPETDQDYAAQLRGYIVKSVSVYGLPIFAAQDEKAGDHLLDAVNLALVAFTLEKSAFGVQRFTADVAMSSSFGLESTKIKEETKHEEPKSRIDGLTKDPHWYNEYKDRKLPLANAGKAVDPTKVWSYPGFLRDLPPPTGPSQSGGMQLGLGKRKTTKPCRNKF